MWSNDGGGAGMKKKKTGLVVLFPGMRYSADCPLLYFAGMKYQGLGYEKIEISGYGRTDNQYSHEEFAERAKKAVEEQMGQYDFSQYEEIVFVSKSIGTVLALWAEESLHMERVVHVLLTPINLTLSFLTAKCNVRFIVSGTNDKQIDLENLERICQKYHLPLKLVKGVGHRLEKTGDADASLRLLRKLVEQM